MKSKENRKVTKIIIFLTLITILTIALIYVVINAEKIVYASNDEISERQNMTIEDKNEEIKISKAKKIDLDAIIQKNAVGIDNREEIVVEETELEYITKYRNNNELYIGKTQVSQEGRKGIQAITIKKTYDKAGNLIKEEQMSAVVVKASINKIIDIGTKEYIIESEKVNQSTITTLDFNMALNKPSGFSLEQFEKALTDSKDKNKVFQNNAKYFYYIEEQYNINGIFVAAVGIHESAWGTSKISQNKYNLFGYGAYDSNPYNGAYSFESYSESIDLIARVFVKHYLNPKGTGIYSGETATGTNICSIYIIKFYKKFKISLAIFLIILYDIRVKNNNKCRN